MPKYRMNLYYTEIYRKHNNIQYKVCFLTFKGPLYKNYTIYKYVF